MKLSTFFIPLDKQYFRASAPKQLLKNVKFNI